MNSDSRRLAPTVSVSYTCLIFSMETDYDIPLVTAARRHVFVRFWPMLVIAGLAINLRPIVTATGPLLDNIRQSTGLGLQAASMLTVLPMLCMGLFPLLLPWLGRRLRETTWITGGLLAIGLASVWRLWIGEGSTLLASTLLAGTGVAVVQALAPGVVKRWYPKRVPLAMGIYSASLMAGGGIAAMLSPVVAQHYDSWQAGLGVWAIPAIFALLLWWSRPDKTVEVGGGGAVVNFFGNRRAWLLAGYFGLVNGGYASVITWLPSYARELGWSAQSSGELIGLMTIFQVLGALAGPALSSKRLDRRPWLLLAVGLQIVGFSGLLLYPESMLIVWVALIGCGLGACFSLTLTVALDHLNTPKMAGALTVFVQGVGFTITAVAPYIAGVLRETTGSFQASWMMILVTLLLMLGATFRFSPAGYAKAMSSKTAAVP